LKSHFWSGILDVFADCTASFVGNADKAAHFLSIVKPSAISFVATVEIAREEIRPAARSAVNLMSNLIGLGGIVAVDALNLPPVFAQMLRRADFLDCQLKQAGLILAMNVISLRCEGLIEQLFESGLMAVLEEALEAVPPPTASFSMAAIDKLAQVRPPTARESEFAASRFVPFLRSCLETDDVALFTRANALLAIFAPGG
jgi:hypothetical protein